MVRSLYVTAARGANLRERLSADSRSLSVLSRGTKVEALGRSRPGDDGLRWYRVKYIEMDGYVAAPLLSRSRPKRAPVADEVMIPVLEYHDVGSGVGEWQVTMPAFKQQLDWLKKNGYTTVRMSQVFDAMDKGKPLPSKPVVLTFDDGRASQWEAVKEMNKRGMTGVFYIMGNGTAMTDNQIRQIVARGHEIGSHSMTHANLDTVSDEKLYDEVVDSKQVLEEKFNVRVEFLAWPFGVWNEKAIPMMKAAGYRGAIGNGGGGLWGPTVYTPKQRWYEYRTIISGYATLEGFAALVKAAHTPK